MNCPVDGGELQMTERQGIEIDYCPRCRGVWLDRGELDKIIDRSVDAPARVEAVPVRGERDAPYQRASRDDDDRDDYRGSERGDHDPRRRKRRSFLEDLFDID